MRIFLVGLPGAGKTAVGRVVADLTGARFVDTDALVEGAAQASIPQIFENFGEPEFRRLEAAAVRKASEMSAPLVVATGGGAVLRPQNVERMRETGRVVWLDVEAREAHRRTRRKGRPLLDAAADRIATLEELKADRDPHYRSAAHVTVRSPRCSPDLVAEAVIAAADLQAAIPVAVPGAEYRVHVGRGVRSRLGELVREVVGGRRCAVVEDESVSRRYGAAAARTLRESGYRVERIRVPPGERSKSWKQLRRLHDAFAEGQLDRQSPVVAIGGGVIGDLAGFAAATWLRGVPLVHVPTTLLAQVDSSVGGKTAINHVRGKNLVGAFHQPALVVTDPEVLESLPDEQMRSGWGEILKYGAAMDRHFFDLLRDEADTFAERDAQALMRAILRSVTLKAGVVSRDEKEAGRRAVLNAGHTVAHALEAATSYRRWSHGEAVAIGLICETQLAAEHDVCEPAVVDRIREVVEEFGLPTSAAAAGAARFVATDKKRRDQVVVSPLINRLGRTRLVELPVKQWKSFIRRHLEP